MFSATYATNLPELYSWLRFILQLSSGMDRLAGVVYE
jgi:hypothetical protein